LDELIPKRFRPWYFRFLRTCIFWLHNQHKGESQGRRLRLALETKSRSSARISGFAR
jgi:ubiquinone biosynthesis protein